MHLIVDAHQDLAYNALEFGRDYSRPALVTRQIEQGGDTPRRTGHTLLGLSDYLLGHVAVIFATLFAAPARRRAGAWETLIYADEKDAHQLYARQMDFYHRFTDEHEAFRLIGSRGDLEAVLTTWQNGDLASRRVGLVPLMEGADGIREPKEAEWWLERGVRIVGLSWAGTRYAGGTGEPGPLTPDGRRLLEAMSGLGLMLDLSHASDESFLEALDRFEGVVLASHANPRALMKSPSRPERFLSDEMIRRLAERGGVIGVVPYNTFLQAGWQSNGGRAAVTLDTLAAAIDHICQVTGSAAHAGLGTDFDGGFGVESVPAEIDTIIDLQLLAGRLAQRGYAEAQIAGIMGQNWIELLRRGLPA